MPINHIRQILDAKLSSYSDMDPNQALEVVYDEKIQTLVKNMTDNFNGINSKVDVLELTT
jgi:hypothetical protein